MVRMSALVVVLALGCTSANVATVATSRGDDAACIAACTPPSCTPVEAAVVTGPGEMIAMRRESRDIALFKFAGDDVHSSVVTKLACMGAPKLERRPDGVHASCAIPPADVRVPVYLATPAPAIVTHVGSTTTIELGPRSTVVTAEPCFTPKADGLVTCEPAGHCFVYSQGQLRTVQLR